MAKEIIPVELLHWDPKTRVLSSNAKELTKHVGGFLHWENDTYSIVIRGKTGDFRFDRIARGSDEDVRRNFAAGIYTCSMLPDITFVYDMEDFNI